MTKDQFQPADSRQALERFRIGVRVALEEMMSGRDYVRVETILRTLAEQADRGPADRH